MTNTTFSDLKQMINERSRRIGELLMPEHNNRFRPPHIRDAVFSYVARGGKRLRPAIVMIACGAVGGDEALALPAAAAVELYHTMSLVHDDIIDRDDMRRGAPSVHHEFAGRGASELGYTPAESEHYGLTVGILTGDVQFGWAVYLLTELARDGKVDPRLALALVADLAGRVTSLLIEGETVDFQQARRPFESLTEAEIIDMLWKKTGILYDFSGRAGAAIGVNDPTLKGPQAESIAEFCANCGIAFQIEDDILGIVGNEAELGKPVGSDIREGKHTVLMLNAFHEANPTQREFLARTLGSPSATDSEIEAVKKLVLDLGSIDYARALAHRYITQALPHLDPLPSSEYKEAFRELAEFMVERRR